MTAHRPTVEPGPRFVKGHCGGDGFLLLLDPGNQVALSEDAVRGLCHPRTGLGGDCLLRLTAADPGKGSARSRGEWFVDCRDADGSHSLACGPGAGFVARYLTVAGLAGPGALWIGTRVGDQRVTVDAKGRTTVEMPTPRVLGTAGVTADGQSFPGTLVSLGALHLVCVIDTPVSYLDFAKEPQPDTAAFPKTVGVLVPSADMVFVNVLPRGSLRVRAYRPGAGEIRPGGAAACAAAAAVQHAAGRRETTVVENVTGPLTVALDASAVTLLTGPAGVAAEGVLDARWLAAL
ncbi:hypothetical protein ACGFLS_01160 [Streptomyces abikoensis]|uniref:hypothetical protein n=1 Tax=Streptomyces abikoensis TaxID=97398 RepID=UPI00372441DD